MGIVYVFALIYVGTHTVGCLYNFAFHITIPYYLRFFYALSYDK